MVSEILTITKSRQLARQARKVIPGGVNSNFRKDTAFQPIYISHGVGGRIIDIDGNEYIDFSLSFGPSILGHSNHHLQQSLLRQVEKIYTPESTELETRAAEKIIQHVPCAELVRFASTGTEANYNAIRVARSFTGRSHIVRFSGHYHGGTDELLGGIQKSADAPHAQIGEYSDDVFSQMANTSGRCESSFEQTFILEWNDLQPIEDLLKREANKIAAVMLEPVMLNNSGCMPSNAYLEGVRALCTQYGIVLIFDEVLTGFRMALGGAQQYFNVIPDMAVFAKAIGGGLPVSAFCGKKEIMDKVTVADVVVGGTYNGHPLCMAAVIATMEELERNDGEVYKHLDKLGNKLSKGLVSLADKYHHPLLIQGFPGALVHSFSSRQAIKNQFEGRGFSSFKTAEFNSLLRQHGVIVNSRICVSTAHTEKDVDEALDRAERAFAMLEA